MRDLRDSMPLLALGILRVFRDQRGQFGIPQRRIYLESVIQTQPNQ